MIAWYWAMLIGILSIVIGYTAGKMAAVELYHRTEALLKQVEISIEVERELLRQINEQ